MSDTEAESTAIRYFLLLASDGSGRPNGLLRTWTSPDGHEHQEAFKWSSTWGPTAAFFDVAHDKELRELVEVTAERAVEVEAQFRAENAAAGHRRPQ